VLVPPMNELLEDSESIVVASSRLKIDEDKVVLAATTSGVIDV